MQRNYQRGGPSYPTARHQGHSRPDSRPRGGPAQPAPSQLASAIRIKNFRFLVTTVSEENLAVALDLGIQRIRELSDGINFSNETTHYIETALALRSGFLDQVNPILADSDIERLKASAPPLLYVEDDEPENSSAVASSGEPAPSASLVGASSVPSQNTPSLALVEVSPSVSEDSALAANQTSFDLSPAPEVAETATTEAPPPALEPPPSIASIRAIGRKLPTVTVKAKKKIIEAPVEAADASAPEPVAQDASEAASAAPAQTYRKQRDHSESEPKKVEAPVSDTNNEQQATPAELAVDPEIALREVRRNNLGLITQAPGSKSSLGRLVGMSPANISHRLHGNKHFDAETAKLFCDKLNLPQGWFDVTRVAEEVPAEILSLLGQAATSSTPSTPAPRTKRPRFASAPSIQTGLAMPRAAGTAPLFPSASTGTPATPIAPSKSVAPIAATAEPEAPAPVEVAAATPATPAVAPEPVAASSRPSRKPAAAPQAEAPVAVPAQPAPSPALVRTPAQAYSPVMAAMEDLAQAEISPITDALIRTLAIKARQGQLSDTFALKILTDIMSL